MNVWDLVVNLALVFTALNLFILTLFYLVWGKVGIYKGLLWLYIKARGPLHGGATCALYTLDPMGPWPEVCVICKFIDACEFMAWDPKEGQDAEDKELPNDGR